MAIRNAQPIPYSSPIFYGEGELSFNEQISQECNFYASPMCLPWDSSEDFCFQFKAGETGSNLLTCLPIDTGTATSTSPTRLIDSTANFVSGGILLYQLVRNTTTGDTFVVTTVNPTILFLGGTPSGPNAFTIGDGYAIYNFYLTAVSIAEIDNVSILADHSICFDRFNGEVQIGFPVGTVGNWYRGTFTISNYSQGQATLLSALGLTNYTLPIASPGTFDWYFGEPLNINRLQFLTTGEFTGCISLCDSEAYLVNRTYAYSVNGGAWTAFTYTGGGLQNGIIEKCIELPEGCDVSVCLSEEAECAIFQTIGQDGNWDTDEAGGISIDGTQVCFDGSMKDDFAYAEEIGCDIDQQVTNIEFELTISGHGTGNVQVCIQNTDPFAPGEVCSSPHGSNGVHTFTLSNFGMATSFKRIIIKAHNNNTTLCATLKYKIQNFQPETFACSECYHVKQLDCETELTWNNDTNSFGHAYNTGYTNRMYVEGRLLNGKIVSLAHDERKGVDSFQRSFFSNGRKVEELAIDAIFPAAHQSIAVGLMHRNFYINGVQYVKIGEYEPDYGDTAEIAPCVVEVAKKDQRYIVNPL